jgi:hypothetical protein
MSRLNQPLILLVLGCVAWAQSKDFWEKKDYRQWTDKECRKLLEDSPWATHYTISEIFFDRVATDTTDRERQQNPKIEYKVQIRSALPIKQGIVRLSQINAKYDQLNEEQRKAFDENAERFIAGRTTDSIVNNSCSRVSTMAAPSSDRAPSSWPSSSITPVFAARG